MLSERHVESDEVNTIAATVRDALVVLEYRPSSLAPPPAGPVDLQGLGPEDVVELGELVSGTREGRTSPAEVTLYRSGGVAVQDAAAAGLVLRRAESGAGTRIDL